MSQRRIFTKRNSSRNFRLPIGLILVLIVIGLCWLLPGISVNLGDINSPDKELPTPLPTFTPPAKPTKEHIGRIIFTCTRGDFNQLCLVNADGTDYQQITNVEAHNYYPVYSPLGGSIVYAANQNGGVFDLFLFVFNGGRLIRLTENIGNVFSPSFSPDGQTILFANRAAEGPTSLWTVDNTGENAKLLYAGPNTIVSADWSPDGKYLLIYAGPTGDKDIFRINVEAKVAEQLTDGGNNAACSYSPDGQWIAFNSLRNDDQADIFIMRADGSSMRQITDNPEPDWQPQWEP